jgi:hypothetical protein
MKFGQTAIAIFFPDESHLRALGPHFFQIELHLKFLSLFQSYRKSFVLMPATARSSSPANATASTSVRHHLGEFPPSKVCTAPLPYPSHAHPTGTSASSRSGHRRRSRHGWCTACSDCAQCAHTTPHTARPAWATLAAGLGWLGQARMTFPPAA